MKRTTAIQSSVRCQRCGWNALSHEYADQARAKLGDRVTFKPVSELGPWPCPEFVRPYRQPWSWRQISPTGWFVLCYIAFLLGIVATFQALAS